MGAMGLVVGCAGAFLGGCVEGPGLDAPWPEGDTDRFQAEVQPVLADQCANPSCHGDVGRPLELFAVHQHRLDPTDVFLDTPLTWDELILNEERALTFIEAGADPETSPLLRKPLAVGQGGAPHAGGDQFARTDDDGYLALRAWIATATDHEETP